MPSHHQDFIDDMSWFLWLRWPLTRIFISTNPIIEIIWSKRGRINRVSPLPLPTNNLINIITCFKLGNSPLIHIFNPIKLFNSILLIPSTQLLDNKFPIPDKQNIIIRQFSKVTNLQRLFKAKWSYSYLTFYQLLIIIIFHWSFFLIAFFILDYNIRKISFFIYQISLS